MAIETAAIALGGTWSIPVGGLNGLADAINAQLGRTPEPQQDRSVTAEMVYEAIEAAGVQDGLGGVDRPVYNRPCDWTPRDTAAVADAINVQLGWRP